MIIGEILIVISGLLLGYVFPDLLSKYGLKDEVSYSYISIIVLSFLVVVAYMTRGIWMNWELAISGINGFTESVFLWFSVTLIIGGLTRVIQHYLKSK